MLLLFVTGGIAFVLFTQMRSTNPDNPEEPPATGVVKNGKASFTKAPFRIEQANLVQEGDSAWLLELAVRYRNQTDAEVELHSPQAKLLTSGGSEVPEFFLAFATPPTIAPDSEELVHLRYWLHPQHRSEELWLQILGEKSQVEVASAPSPEDVSPPSS